MIAPTRADLVRNWWHNASSIAVAGTQHLVAWAVLGLNVVRIQQGLHTAYGFTGMTGVALVAARVYVVAIGVALELVNMALLWHSLSTWKQRVARRGRWNSITLGAMGILVALSELVSYGFNLLVDSFPLGALLPTLSLACRGLIVFDAMTGGQATTTMQAQGGAGKWRPTKEERALADAVKAEPRGQYALWGRMVAAKTKRATPYSRAWVGKHLEILREHGMARDG